MRNALFALTFVAGMATGAHLGIGLLQVKLDARNLPPTSVICESGSEVRDPHLTSDPYYVHSQVCNLNDSNGRSIIVITID